ncbi:MAG: protein kinase, partial [Planctomycetes bacterium]|nr:protein kinase [Planctomycetota bacterium]
MISVPCPNTLVLGELLLGKLAEEQAEPLEEHLLQCDKCAAKAQTIRHEDTLVNVVRAYQPPTGDKKQAIDRVVRRGIQVAGQSGSAFEIAADASPNEGSEKPAGLLQRLAGIVGPQDAADDERKEDASVGDYDFLAPPEADDEIGRLGNYRVLQVIGSGGMGVVFMAEDPELQRKVALKAMHPALAASASARDRFLREARATAAIDHENVITIHQVGKDRGIPYLAMSLLRGQSLDDRFMPGQPLATPDVLRIGKEIAAGLAAAHREGLIHRDIKPANIWLEEQSGRVKILDFGLAHSHDSESHLTRPGTVVGTPAFMSPEQARGEALDPRADLFSLGCILYLISTGEPAFYGMNHATIMAAVENDDPQPLKQLKPHLPAELSELVMRLLAKDPDHRPPSADDVAESLSRIESTLAEPSSDADVHLKEKDLASAPAPAGRLSPAAKNRRPFFITVAAIALLLLVGGGYYAYTVIVKFSKGQLIVETNDKDVEIIIKREGDEPQVKVIDHKTKRVIYLTPGKYEIEVTIKDGGQKTQFFTKSFSLKRGDEEILNVRLELAKLEKLKPKDPATAQTDPLLGDIVSFEPIDEWLEGRKILTVAQDGSGDFRTISKALEALQPGQVVMVLDKGPYRERLQTTVPEDVGLISQFGTLIEFTDWNRTGPGFVDQGKSLYRAAVIDCPSGLRISRFTFRCPKVPEDAEMVQGLVLLANGEVTIEACKVLLDPEDQVSLPPDEISDVLDFRAIEFNQYKTGNRIRAPETKLLVQDSLLDGVTVVNHLPTTRLLFQRNYVVGWPRSGVAELRPSRKFVVRHNMIRAWKGVSILGRTWESTDQRKRDRYLIANNVFDTVQHGVYVLPSIGRVTGRIPYPHDVVIRNNVFKSRQSGGIALASADLPTVKGVWQADHNCYLSAPQTLEQFLSFPKHRSDLVLPAPFLSNDPPAADYARIAANSVLATAGAGGELPNYIGALPPGPAPADG